MKWVTWGFLLYYFLSQFSVNKTRTRNKANEAKTKTFLWWLWKELFGTWCLKNEVSQFLSEFFFGGVSLVRPCCFPSYSSGFWARFWIHGRLTAYTASHSAVRGQNKARATSSNALCCPLKSPVCRDSRLEYRICNGRPNGPYIFNTNVSAADLPIAKLTPREENFFFW